MTDDTQLTAKLESVKRNTTDSDMEFSERYSVVTFLYIQTGEMVAYLDHQGTRKVFAPSKKDAEERKDKLKHIRRMEGAQHEIKRAVFFIMLFFVIGASGLLFFFSREDERPVAGVS